MNKGITLKQFVDDVESSIVPQAKENSEGSYELAKLKVMVEFSNNRLILTENQVRNIVNRVWDRVHKDEEVA